MLPQAYNQNNQSDRPVGLVFLFPFLCFSSSFLRLLNCFFFLLFSSGPGSSSGIPSLSYNTCVALRCRRVVFFTFPLTLPLPLLFSTVQSSSILTSSIHNRVKRRSSLHGLIQFCLPSWVGEFPVQLHLVPCYHHYHHCHHCSPITVAVLFSSCWSLVPPLLFSYSLSFFASFPSSPFSLSLSLRSSPCIVFSAKLCHCSRRLSSLSSKSAIFFTFLIALLPRVIAPCYCPCRFCIHTCQTRSSESTHIATQTSLYWPPPASFFSLFCFGFCFWSSSALSTL